jgi:transcriptional regulator with GAF, ATPase, and Fis domain
VIERAAILARGSLLEIDNALELRLEDQEPKNTPDQLIPFEDMERAYILKVLERTRWVIEGEQGAAAILDLNPSTLRSRMQKLNIRKPKSTA